jgi:hypothetical protein
LGRKVVSAVAAAVVAATQVLSLVFNTVGRAAPCNIRLQSKSTLRGPSGSAVLMHPLAAADILGRQSFNEAEIV